MANAIEDGPWAIAISPHPSAMMTRVARRPSALLSCGRRRASRSAPYPRQNVLLVTIDTLRADALGATGAGGDAALDRLAAEGVRFDFAHRPRS